MKVLHQHHDRAPCARGAQDLQNGTAQELLEPVTLSGFESPTLLGRNANSQQARQQRRQLPNACRQEAPHDIIELLARSLVVVAVVDPGPRAQQINDRVVAEIGPFESDRPSSQSGVP